MSDISLDVTELAIGESIVDFFAVLQLEAQMLTCTLLRRQFRACLCGTSALPQPLDDFWTALMQKRIVQRYGATEFGSVLKIRLDDQNAPDGSVGELESGIDLKLSGGNEGEILVKSPVGQLKYPRAYSTHSNR